MTDLNDPAVKALLDQPNHAVVSTFNADGSIHSTVVWQELAAGRLSVNSGVGRHWPNNLERDPRITVVVYAQDNPYQYVEVRGRATGTLEGAEAQIDRMAKKYMGVDEYPMRQAGEQRITYVIEPERVRLQG